MNILENELPGDIITHFLIPYLFEGNTLQQTIIDYPSIDIVSRHPKFSIRNAIYAIAQDGTTEMMEYVIKNGGNVRARDNKCLELALRYNSYDMVRFLIESGCDVRYKRSEALRIITAKEEKEVEKILDLLLEKGAHIEELLYEAIRYSMGSYNLNWRLYLQLVRKHLTIERGQKGIEYICRYKYSNCKRSDIYSKVFYHLWSVGIPVDTHECLRRACKKRDVDLVKVIVRCGGDVVKQDLIDILKDNTINGIHYAKQLLKYIEGIRTYRLFGLHC